MERDKTDGDIYHGFAKIFSTEPDSRGLDLPQASLSFCKSMAHDSITNISTWCPHDHALVFKVPIPIKREVFQDWGWFTL